MRKILKVLFVYCISFIFFSGLNVLACNYKSADNRVRISLKTISTPFEHVMVSITIDGETKTLDPSNGSIVVESSLISQIKLGQCPTIYYSCSGSTCSIYTQSIYGAAPVNPLGEQDFEEDLFCTYVSDDAKFLISREDGYTRVYGLDNFPNMDVSNFEDFNNFSMFMTENKCDSELYYDNFSFIYLDDAVGRVKATLTNNDIFLDCSYRSVDLKHYNSQTTQPAFTIKYNLLTNKIQGDINGFGFFENKNITKNVQRVLNNTCDSVLYYSCNDDNCTIYSTSAVSNNKSVAVLNELLKGCDYALSDDNTAGFQIYYYDKYAYALPTMNWSNGTTITSVDIGDSLSSCPNNMYYKCNELRHGQECMITIDNSDYQSDDIMKETKKANLIGQREAPSVGIGVTTPPADAQTTPGNVSVCYYTMQGNFDEKSGFRIRYVQEMDEIEVWPTGLKARDALFTGGGYKIINQLPPEEIKSGNCLEEFYYKVDESVGNKYKFTLSDSSDGKGWNLATLDK